MLSASKLATLLFVLLSAVPALSQPTVSNLTITGLSPTTVTAATCTSAQALAFTVTGSGANILPGNTVNVYVISTQIPTSSGSACPAITFPLPNPAVVGATYVNVFPGNTQGSALWDSNTVSFSLNRTNFNNPTVVNLNPEVCGGSPVANVSYALCAYAVNGTGNAVLATSAAAFFTPSTTPPTISVTPPSPQDGKIEFSVTSNQAETAINICYITDNGTGTFDTTDVSTLNALAGTSNACTGGSPILGFGLQFVTLPGTINGTGTATASAPFEWAGVHNGTQYQFIVEGNVGLLWNTPVLGPVTPVKAYSTLESYQGEGNGISWACSQSSGPVSPASLATLGLLFVAALFISPARRRRTLRFLGLTVVCFTMLGQSAHADAGQLVFGLTGTFYKPNFDKNTTYPVYANLYNGAWMPKLGFDLDWHVFDAYGSLQLGFATSFAWATGLASLNPPSTTYSASASPVAMYLLRVDPRATWVLDEYVEDFPVVPFVQAGINMLGYYITYQGDPDRNGESGGKNPLGMKFGWQVGAGVMLMLDWMEPEVSASARALGTYSHTYLKAAVSYVKIDDFTGKGFDFSPAHFGSDLPLQLDFAMVFEFQ